MGKQLAGHAVQQLLQYDSVITLSLSSTLREALAERARRKPFACTGGRVQILRDLGCLAEISFFNTPEGEVLS